MLATRKFLHLILLSGLVLSAAQPVLAAEDGLSFKRLFAAPGLDGPQTGAMKFSPDSSKIAYLKGSDSEPRRYDLWLYDVASKEQKLVVAAASLTAAPAGALTDDERARRERTRVMASGIVSFDWSPASDAVMFPWNGQVQLYRLTSNALEPVSAAESGGDMSNAALSLKGGKLAYVSGNDLFVLDLTDRKTKRLTKSKDPLLRYGVAEFVAAEEIGRETGFWWSPDGRMIAVIEVDSRPVPLQSRYEILADDWRINHEPYPQAGKPNVRLRLALIDVKSGKQQWLDLTSDIGAAADFYLARIKWLSDSSGLLVTRQNRDQKTVDVLLYDKNAQSHGTLIHETSDTWVDLHNDLIELTTTPALLWGSDRDGPHRIYRYGKDGKLEGALTPMSLFVDHMVSVDEIAGKLYVEGYEQDPRERHLYSVDLDAKTDDKPQRLTLDAGMHSLAFSSDGKQVIDRYTSPAVPYLVTLRPTDGGSPSILSDGRITPSHPYSAYNASHVPPQFGSIRAADGTELYYRLLMPRGLKPGQRVPVLVHVYGGPGFQLVTNSWGPLWQQVALARGYAVFMLDNRGSARRGKAFETPIYHNLGSVEVQDQLAGIAWLKARPDIDPTRVAVFGWSYGGYMSLKIAEAAGDGLRAAISGAPVTDWRLYDSHYTERFMGQPQDNAAAYDKSSVYPELDHMKAPLLLIHGMADDNVLFTNSTKLMAALQQSSHPFALMTYPGMTHSPREPVVQEHLYETMFDFLDQKMGK
ncbi:S9 family peptidase [Govanella unica]|uniref:S9 family peptidase n=1 Tax=Govanella unica TaxID=2975056 RepID=A0A9X3U0Z7_9PROT|nr:alpha/beta fold hydrolase [Govania unica]MDA5195098.1 S9 family peptidase [Govania unica]